MLILRTKTLRQQSMPNFESRCVVSRYTAANSQEEHSAELAHRHTSADWLLAAHGRSAGAAQHKPLGEPLVKAFLQPCDWRRKPARVRLLQAQKAYWLP